MENKVTKEIFNPINENIKKLESLFPEIVKDGQVDFEALKQELGQFEEVGKEKYELTWPGKTKAKQLANTDIVGRTLKYVPEDSKNPETTENLYIEGDNLEVLKLLRNSYYGKIKMIYIDPPYNTGNDFIYKDDYSVSSKENELNEGNIDEEGNRLVKNQAGSGRFHSNWLNMMYPRLKIAKDLLTDDGVIFISIDDNEVDNLRKICDEIFFEENFVNCISVKMSEVSGNKMSHSNKKFPKVKEYILVYKKHNLNIVPVKLKKDEWDSEYNKFLKNFTKEHRNLIKYISSKDEITDNDINLIDEILSAVEEISLNQAIKEFNVSEDKLNSWLIENSYRIFRTASSSSVKALVEEKNKIKSNIFISVISKKDKKLYIAKTNFSNDSKSPRVQVLFADEYLEYTLGDLWTDITTTGLEFEGDVDFKNGKKPVKMIERLINICEGNDFVVMDFFSGSGTTAEAVFRSNIRDNGRRKSILVQLDENLDETYVKATGDAKILIDFLDGINRPHFLTEIGKERIRRAGEKIKEEFKDKEGIEKLDVGFKVFRVDGTNIRWNNEALKEGQITIEESTLKNKDLIDFNHGFTDIDVVYEIILRHRDFPLTSKIEKLSNIGERTYIFADAIVVCLEEKVTDKIVDGIAAIEPKPIKVIFRDSAFEDDISLKLNTMNRLDAQLKKHNQGKEQSYRVEFI